MRPVHWLTPAAITFLLALNGGLTSQTTLPNTGGAVVIGQTLNPAAVEVRWYGSDGKQTGRFFLSTGHTGPGGITPAPRNDGVLFTCVAIGSPFTPELHRVDRAGRVSRIATLPAFLQNTPALLLDSLGDVLLLNQSRSPATGGIFRRSARSGVITTVAAGIVNAVAMEEDPGTGELIVADTSGNVMRVSWNGTVTSIGKGAFPPMPGGVVAKMHSEFRDGSVLTTWGDRILRFAPNTSKTTTVVAMPGTLHFGIDYDPIRGKYYRVDTRVLSQFEPRTGLSLPLAWFPTGFLPQDVATWASRGLNGTGVLPAPGATYAIELSMPAEAGQSFAAAAALGTTHGIPTPAGPIPLDPDPFFFLSLTNPQLFQNFTGALDATGRAVMSIRIPNASGLRGFRFFVAAVTHDAKSIRRITEPFGVTVR